MLEVEEKIIEILSKNLEELEHAQKTLKWLLRIKPDASPELRIAALGHDIDRVVEPWKVIDYNLEKEFRMKHAKRSADFIIGFNLQYLDKDKLYNLILNHEFGGGEADWLRDADSLSNFEWYDMMFEKLKAEDSESGIVKMFERMSRENRRFIDEIKFTNKEAEEIVKSLVKND
jgi:hypothetical protein